MARLKFWIGLVVGASCLWLVFRGIEFPELLAAVRQVDAGMLALAMLVNLFSFWLRSLRWKAIFSEPGVTARRLFPSLAIGFMANNIFPARAGEFIRAFLGAKRLKQSGSKVFATILIERLWDLATMIVALVAVALLLDFNHEGVVNNVTIPRGPTVSVDRLLHSAGWGGAVLLAVMVAFLAGLRLMPQRVMAGIRLCSRPFPERFGIKLLELADEFVLGVRTMKNVWQVVVIIFWSLLVWLVVVISFLLAFRAFHIELGVLPACMLLVMTSFSTAIPSPGYAGPLHLAVQVSLMFFAVNASLAAAFAVVLHGMVVVPITVIGTVCVWREGLSLRKVRDDATSYDV